MTVNKHEVRRGLPDALLPYKDACGDGRNSAIMVAKKKKARHSQFARLIFGLRAVILMSVL